MKLNRPQWYDPMPCGVCRVPWEGLAEPLPLTGPVPAAEMEN